MRMAGTRLIVVSRELMTTHHSLDWMNDTLVNDQFRIISSDKYNTTDAMREGGIDGNATIKFFQRNTVTPGTSPPDRGCKLFFWIRI